MMKTTPKSKPNNYERKLKYVVFIFILIIGLSLVLTYFFKEIGGSSTKVEYKGILVTGSAATFIGLFQILSSGFKKISSAIGALSITLLIAISSLFISNNIFDASKASKIEKTSSIESENEEGDTLNKTEQSENIITSE